MDSYVIIGTKNARKSSTVRSLTGCFKSSEREVALLNGIQILVYARVLSLQESNTSAAKFINEMKSKGSAAVIFCLWPDKIPALPDARSYLEEFQRSGWAIRGVAILGQPLIRNLARFNPIAIPNSKTDPSNVTARQVRKHFGWQ